MFGLKNRQKELDRQANELFKRGLCLQNRATELEAREKRIAEREEMVTVRLTVEDQASKPLRMAQDSAKELAEALARFSTVTINSDRVVAKHPLLAATYGTPMIPMEDYKELLSAYGALKKARNADPKDNFATLRAANVARNPEWFPDGAPPVLPASFRGTELAGEVGEGVEAAMTHLAMLTASSGRICNILKKLERERLGLNGSRSTKEALAEELGDFIICADLVGMDFDIPLWPSVVSKFNATSSKLGMKTMLPTPEHTTYTAKDEQNHRVTCDECGGSGSVQDPPGVCMSCIRDGWTYR